MWRQRRRCFRSTCRRTRPTNRSGARAAIPMTSVRCIWLPGTHSSRTRRFIATNFVAPTSTASSTGCRNSSPSISWVKTAGALRESEAKFRSYVENAPVAVLVADAKGCLVDCNPAAGHLLGCDAATLLGTSIKDLHPAEDLEEVRQTYQLLATRKHVEGECRFKRQDGKLIWVSLRAVMTGSGHSIGFCQDITERRQVAEAIANERQLLRTLIDLLPETFYVKDLDS